MNTNNNHSHRRFGMLSGMVVGALVLLGATAAYAGCDPACAEGDVCRYEAAGGKFYCAPSVTKGAVKGAKTTPRTPSEPGSPGAGRPAPVQRTPNTGR